MSNALSPRLRAAIINYNPAQPNALSVTEFCRSLKISRSVFYKIRDRAARESTAALHPRSRAPKTPARKYGPEVINEVVRIRKTLKAQGWEYGPRSIYYEAVMQETFPGDHIPSVATIARLLASVGQVDAAPKKRPKSSYVPFARSTAMSLWQLDAFEYRLSSGKMVTVYQLLDDASRFDVGSWAYQQHENSADTQDLLHRAIHQYGPPQELLSDNSLAFNQLRQGVVGAVEVFLASHGTMPITGIPGKPTTQGKNERAHQTLKRFLDASRPATLAALRRRITIFREHYNHRRPHQALADATPASAWEVLAHTPATEPIALVVLQAKAAQYIAARNRRDRDLHRAGLTITKTGEILPAHPGQAVNQAIVEVTSANRQIYYHGYRISLPTSLAGQKYYRTITDAEYLLADLTTAEVVFSFPLPMRALKVHDRHVASYSIEGVASSRATKQWDQKRVEYHHEFTTRRDQTPAVFEL